MNEIEKQFEKYKVRGADYHWKEINSFNVLHFNSFLVARYQKISEQVSRLIKTLPSATTPLQIVDFGCGDGVQLHVVRKSNSKTSFEFAGIDLSPEAIPVAKRKLSGDFQVGSVYETPYESNRFDFAISCDVIEHLQEPERMVDEMVRVTKPGKFIVIGTPLKYTEIPQDTMHVKEYFLEEFKELFAGRTDVTIKEQIASHRMLHALLYLKTFSVFSLKLPLIKYLFNVWHLLSGKNPFMVDNRRNKELMTYQFIILQKKA